MIGHLCPSRLSCFSRGLLPLDCAPFAERVYSHDRLRPAFYTVLQSTTFPKLAAWPSVEAMALEEEAEKRMVTASVQRLTISWPTAWVSSRGAVVLSGPVSRIEAKTLSQPYDSAAIAPDDGGSHIGGG